MEVGEGLIHLLPQLPGVTVKFWRLHLDMKQRAGEVTWRKTVTFGGLERGVNPNLLKDISGGHEAETEGLHDGVGVPPAPSIMP